ncbi:NAD(P)H-dependent flavin oxidoreductase [Risungbinella massiliensis]|uniref:NAD(P)H-dependent flavin oxidoreductase n=1 Tax=Risungbinella massiliensis TaxID=1329796 RepID=UPI0005CC8DF4|nr:nitronate monooxygenase [Risungbinella massiliensis]
MNKLGNILNIQYPIIQAGMAGGPTTVQLVSQVSNAGALGTLGAGYLTPDAMRQAIRAIKESTNLPFAVNLFCTSMQDDWGAVKEVQSVLNPIREQLGIPVPNKIPTSLDFVEEQFAICIEEQVPIISTAFGLLPTTYMRIAKEAGRKIISMVTTVEEGLQAEEAGVDVIVAQGSDAGGHRSTFNVSEQPMGANIGTFSLVPQMVDAVKVPVVAAGGIMDGRGMVAAFALGASGIQLGTRFLTTKESGAHPAYQKALLASTEESTVITKSFSGRPARGIRNRFIEQMDSSQIGPLPFPSQNTLTGDIRKRAAETNQTDYMSLWAGQATRLLKAEQTAEEVIRELLDEAEKVQGILFR